MNNQLLRRHDEEAPDTERDTPEEVMTPSSVERRTEILQSVPVTVSTMRPVPEVGYTSEERDAGIRLVVEKRANYLFLQKKRGIQSVGRAMKVGTDELGYKQLIALFPQRNIKSIPESRSSTKQNIEQTLQDAV